MRMRTPLVTLVGALLTLGVCGWGGGAEDVKNAAGILPADAVPTMIDEDRGILDKALTELETAQKSLKAAAPGSVAQKKAKVAVTVATRKAKAASIMIAVYAQDAMAQKGADAKKLATLREAAIDLSKSLAGGDVAAAKAAAAKLTPNIPADPNAKPVPRPLGPLTETEIVMTQFKRARAGGQDIEYNIEQSVKEKAPSPADLKTWAKVGLRTAAIGELIEGMLPEPVAGKDPKDWVKWSKAMKEGGLELAAAAKANNQASVLKALNKLDATCTACHKVFKPGAGD